MKLSGAKKERLKLKLFEKQEGLCAYCGRPMRLDVVQNSKMRATLDHIIPLFAGGTWAKTNLILSCRKCNNYKGCAIIPEWLWGDINRLHDVFKNHKIHEIMESA